MRESDPALCIVFSVPAAGRGAALSSTAPDLKSALGLRPMALAEAAREASRDVLAILSDDENLLSRAEQLGPRCGLKVTRGAITPIRVGLPQPGGSPAGADTTSLVSGALLSGPRAGFEKLFEVLSASGEKGESILARRGDAALQGEGSGFEIDCGRTKLRPRRPENGGRPLVMGVLNVTPDSFSDGGRFADPAAAIERGLAMAQSGADIIDVGGESSRPGSAGVTAEEECRRVLPVIEGIVARTETPVSIDTTKAEVARRAASAGAVILNDISGMTMDEAMPAEAAALGLPVVLNHIRGVPKTMQDAARYEHVVLEVLLELAARVRLALRAGVARSKIIVDPGIGFGKNVADNLAILGHLSLYRSLGAPILVGVSRKSFLGAVTGRAVGDRQAATLAAEAIAVLGGADILRTHEPAATLDAIKVASAIAAGSL